MYLEYFKWNEEKCFVQPRMNLLFQALTFIIENP